MWLLLAGVGMAVLWRYENTPGPLAKAPVVWPAQSKLIPHETLPTLVMFLHPQCPCSRAGVEELARIMAQCQGKVSATVAFYKPAESDASWTKTSLWEDAAAIPGVTVAEDIDGAEALGFHAETSGSVYLFGTDKSLLYQGGITISRGHAGDNAGSDAVKAILLNKSVTCRQTKVFGCLLQSDSETERKP